MTDAIKIPADLLPADGRFGAGPSKIQPGHLDALAATTRVEEARLVAFDRATYDAIRAVVPG